MKKMITVMAVLSISAFVYADEINVDFDGKNEISISEMTVNKIANLEIEILEADSLNKKNKAYKEWTIMVFVNAKNNLEKYGLKDVNEME
ncbi:MAG: hypothetical protein KAI33_03075, partial [Elusimicrobiales bacterium]|nr:hypothetical protein [Elusimicrobiales bacterium]